MLKYILVIFVTLLVVLIAATAYMSRSLFSESRSELPPLPEVAPRDQALTFARTESRLLLVIQYQFQSVKAIDLSSLYGAEVNADPIGLFERIGYDSLASLTSPEILVDVRHLQLPLDFGATHLAAGTNYTEHSDEVMLDDPPFLFPKNVDPTPWNSAIPFTKRLDYEAELAAIPLAPIQSPDDTPSYGLILANDFTDRWKLIKELKLRKPMGTTGFAASKGREGFLPTGYFFVIPKDESFYTQIELRLYVNDKLRQRFKAEDMILKIDDMARQAFTDRQQQYFDGRSEVELIPESGIERGSMLLTGTSGGVIFKPVNIWWQGLYLKPGDVVRTEASYLGILENAVVKAE